MRDVEALPKISDGSLPYGRAFPVLWFGLLSLGAVFLATKNSIAVLQPVALMVFGYFAFRHQRKGLADEVLDGGTFLLVRKGDLVERVELRDVMNINFTRGRSSRVTLKLRTPGALGEEVAFIPALFSTPDELIVRVDAERLRRKEVFSPDV